ncbi:MFS general substrate transporter, partial [Lophiostoma macrostomum CBS 122681]
SIVLSLFLTNMEIPIVTTSLVAITSDLGGFDKIGWVISSYLLGYVGVLVIFAKLSDIFGRKLMLSISISIFILFSAGCGAAQTLTQLIVLRAFQGVGGAGCFALGSAILAELVPPEQLAKYVANISIVYGISLLCGPILGGAISAHAWRWVFLLNIPAAAPALAFAILAIPQDFPHHARTGASNPLYTWKARFSKETRAKVDTIGATLLLLATLSMTAGFEEADSRFPWKSAFVITLLSVSGVLWITLLLWERRVTNDSAVIEPVLPWRFMKNRAMLSLLLNAVFLGGPWFVSVFQLPQKFQVVHGSSGLRAGIQTMPFTFAAPLGSAFSSIAAGKLRVPVVFVSLFAGCLQIIGYALLASLPPSTAIDPRVYGYQFIAGFGCGINISTLMLILPFVVEPRDKAVGLGAVTQLRVMGGAIVLSVATSVFNGYTRPLVANFLRSINALADAIVSLQTLSKFSEQEQVTMRMILARGYSIQMYILCAFATAQLPAAWLLWRRRQVLV